MKVTYITTKNGRLVRRLAPENPAEAQQLRLMQGENERQDMRPALADFEDEQDNAPTNDEAEQ